VEACDEGDNIALYFQHLFYAVTLDALLYFVTSFSSFTNSFEFDHPKFSVVYVDFDNLFESINKCVHHNGIIVSQLTSYLIKFFQLEIDVDDLLLHASGYYAEECGRKGFDLLSEHYFNVYFARRKEFYSSVDSGTYEYDYNNLESAFTGALHITWFTRYDKTLLLVDPDLYMPSFSNTLNASQTSLDVKSNV